MGSVTLDRCPLALCKDPYVDQALSAFYFFEKGHLPRPGGLVTQTAHFLELMPFLADLRAEYNEWYRNQKKPKG